MFRLFNLNKGLTKIYRRFSEIAKFSRNFLSPSNVAFLEQEHARWLQDKNSVSKSFQTYF
jgi:2-oxoglutarate dehydrogenase complex dehydrogenase (E1) component-like enzyme